MAVDTEGLRHAGEVLDVLTSKLPDTHALRVHAARDAKNCVAVIYSAADHIDAQEAEIDALRANLEHHQACWITHRGAALVCSSVVRNAYSDEKVCADAAEAAIERLSDALSVAREFIATSRTELVVAHGINGVIPADDTLGLAGVADCDARLKQIDSALSGEGK